MMKCCCYYLKTPPYCFRICSFDISVLWNIDHLFPRSPLTNCSIDFLFTSLQGCYLPYVHTIRGVTIREVVCSYDVVARWNCEISTYSLITAATFLGGRMGLHLTFCVHLHLRHQLSFRVVSKCLNTHFPYPLHTLPISLVSMSHLSC